MSAFATSICPRCRSAFDEVCAREPWPAEMDPERCSCGALLSFRYRVDGLWIRRRIER